MDEVSRSESSRVTIRLVLLSKGRTLVGYSDEVRDNTKDEIQQTEIT